MYRIVMSLALLISFLPRAVATTDPVITKPLKGSEGKVKVDAESYARDLNYFLLSQANRDNITNNKITNMVGVGIEEPSTFYIPGNFSVKVELEISSYDKDENLLNTKTKFFNINYDAAAGAKYTSFEDTVFYNAFAVKAKIVSIDSGGINWPVSKVLRVENQLTAARDYPFDCTLALSGLSANLLASDNELTVTWNGFSLNTNPGVTEYDLEWAWVDEGAVDNYKLGFYFYQPLLFENNATRVSIGGTSYNIPLLYDDTGRIFIRVRPVQLRTDGQRVEGKWTWISNDAAQSFFSTTPVFYTYNGHEDHLNWQASTSYAEEGKRKSVVQYFDGSLRTRQTVTKDNSSNTTVVAESFYDYQGRAVIQVLPAPTLNTAIGYAHNFNKAVNEEGYPKWVYDKVDAGVTACSNPAKPFETSTGTAKYYSPNNDLPSTDPLRPYIPSATGNNPNEAYAFSETRLSPDGRVAAQGGVGITHQIGSNHETKYFYESPGQEELDALFGTDAGVASHYFKNIVKDANGQYSVSYTDMHGRTVATALAGEAPKNPDGTPKIQPLPSQNSVSFTKQLIDDETNLVDGNSITTSKPIIVMKDARYKFDYSLTPKQLNILSCTGTPICYDCLYKVKFTISSDCDNSYLYADSLYNFTLGQFLNNCNSSGNANQGFLKHFEVDLPEGSYIVTKTLTLSSDAQDKYRSVFLSNDTCRKFTQFYSQELAFLQANSNCNMTCESCKTALGGDFNGFKAKYASELNITVSSISPELNNQLLISYNEAYDNCQKLCPNDGMDVVRSIREMMLQDMTPPYGQYAQTTPDQVTRNYNIFKPAFFGLLTPYKTPVQYDKNDITVLSTLKYFDEYNQEEIPNPRTLSVADFAAQFKSFWANQLIWKHPEFKKLQLSENQLKASYQFEANLENDTTWAQAAGHTTSYITNLIDNDPFFSGPSAPGAAYKWNMLYGYGNGPSPVTSNLDLYPIIHGINTYMVVQNGKNCSPHVTGNFISMWQLALSSVFCRDKNDPVNPCAIDYSDPTSKIYCLVNKPGQPTNTYSEGCVTDRDWAWKIFKQLYLAERRKLISAYLNANAPSFTTAPNNGLPPYQLRFINYANPQAAMSNLGDDAQDVQSIINNLNNNLSATGTGVAQAQSLQQAQYDTVCTGYANTWIAQLRACPQINTILDNSTTWRTDSAWLVTRLKAVCINGADDGHFLGSSSVKPGNHAFVNGVSYDDFPQVIKEFLQNRAGITQPYTADCYPWLINVPKPYGSQPALANSYVLTKPAPCECQRINDLRMEWTSNISSGVFSGDFSAYMQYQHGTTISNEQLDALTAICNGNYQCKMFEKPVPLPPAMQCRGENGQAPKTCISCQEYHDLKSDFLAATGQPAPFLNPQSQAEINYNHSFANFANNRTGFSKLWTEYVAFENACAASNPEISCESLQNTLDAFYHSPEYLQNPTGMSCVQAFVNYFNAHFGIIRSYSQWMEMFARCGSHPTVCKQEITCSLMETLIDDFYNQNGVQIYKNSNCQSLFVNYINTRLVSNYTYNELEAVYRYTCKNECDFNICGFLNHFLLKKVYDKFKSDNPHPWNLSDCKQAFTDYFNNYFGVEAVLSFDDINKMYDKAGTKCAPDLSKLCNPPYSCEQLKSIRDAFIMNPENQPIDELPNCQQKFADYFNTKMGTDYIYSELVSLYWELCEIKLEICKITTDCKSILAFVSKYLELHHGVLCKEAFITSFDDEFGTDYTEKWEDLVKLFEQCEYQLKEHCETKEEVVISEESLKAFLADFKEKYPDPATQLGNECEQYFTARFNEKFGTQYSYAEIEAYYATKNITLDACAEKCPEVSNFINSFNTQYTYLKLPEAAKEDLFAFAYNNAFLKDAVTGKEGKALQWKDTDNLESSEENPNQDPKIFDPLVHYPEIREAINNCGITDLNLAPSATISIGDPQVLLSLKQVYYIIHPKGLPDDCQSDFQGWFNRVMKTQYEYNELLGQYNTVSGNNTGYICENPPNEEVKEVSVFVDLNITENNPVVLPPMLCGLNEPAGGSVAIDDDPCKDLPAIAFNSALDKYELYIDSLRNVFDTAYYNKCMAAKDLESFTVTYNTSEYHYTLYYYDQAGNLVKTVPPAGVVRLSGADLQTVKTYRANVLNGGDEGINKKVPLHTMATEYRYNTLNQVVEQKTPDGGTSNFYYDRLGRLAVSQNDKQRPVNHYSYTLYDDFGRIKEVGQLTNATQLWAYISKNGADENTSGSLKWWLKNKPATEITRTFYDKSYFDGSGTLCPQYLCQENLRNRVSYTALYPTGIAGTVTVADHSSATYYSYDIHGNVDVLLQDYNQGYMKYKNPALTEPALSADANLSGNRFKKLVYDYDLISGKVNEITYQPDYYDNATNQLVKPADQFSHRYTYDAENRIIDVETSRDKVLWEKDARYSYYKHGPLARTILGELQVQGLDYAYTLQGWLKGINSTSVGDANFDMGGDGKLTGTNSSVARDAFGYSLNYFTGDYKPIAQSTAGFANPFAGITTLPAGGKDLFNGNINSMVVNLPTLETGRVNAAKVYSFGYDQLNRLLTMDGYEGINNVSNTFTPIAINNQFQEQLKYDANGNIIEYKRNGNGSNVFLNNYKYNYTAGSNRLKSIDKRDAADVVTANKTYDYDEIGNTTADEMQDVSNVVWNVYGKLQSCTNKNGQAISYTYGADGQRIYKTVGSVVEYYVRDAAGNIMTTYKKDAAINSNHLTVASFDKYGSSYLGTVKANIDMEAMPAGGATTVTRGITEYIITDHRGNNMLTVSDKKIAQDDNHDGIIDYYTADVLTASYYSAYGAISKSFNSSEIDKAHNGQKRSVEISEFAQTALYWEYNGDVGRRWNIDPKPNVSMSPYSAFENNPIWHIDIKGDTTGDVVVMFAGANVAAVGGSHITKGLGSTPKAAQMLKDKGVEGGTAIGTFSSKYWGTDLKKGEGFGEATQAAYEFIKANYKPGGKVVIYGYSFGGAIVNELADRLMNDNIRVNLLVTVDAAGGKQNDYVRREVSTNVDKNLNVYQTNPEALTGSHGAPNKPHFLYEHTKVQNINFTNYFVGEPGTKSYQEVKHSNIDQIAMPLVTTSILQVINVHRK